MDTSGGNFVLSTKKGEHFNWAPLGAGCVGDNEVQNLLFVKAVLVFPKSAQIGTLSSNIPHLMLLPPQGFGPEAKTRGGIIETPA